MLLGASNLTLGFPTVLRTLRAGAGGHLDILAAHGHGRSYGRRSRVMFRWLPGIIDCDLWNHLDGRPEMTRALITDVGNDLLYGSDVDQLLDWIGVCLGRLAQYNAEMILTLPPLVSLQALPAWRFHLLRRAIFPHSRLKYADAKSMAAELNAGLRELGERHRVQIIEPRRDWYGLDPIHIRPTTWQPAWSQIFETWHLPLQSAAPASHTPVAHENSIARTALRELSALQIWRLRPAERTLFKTVHTVSQPVLDTNELTVSLY